MAEERYEIRGKIGQGGVGAVYKAYDTQLRREVAIKRVLADELDEDNETATKNLLKEATALSSVQHPHICTVYDAGLDDDGPFVVMELINGKTLDEMVERGTLTYEDFREVAIQTQEAMIAAQELNLVHRDLKPSNVMVSWLPSGRFQIKLVDFGLAKFSAKPSLQTIDHGDAVFGSIFFMAPEQFERTPLDQRTDMYSLGAMFYYSLTGNYPFDGDTAPQVMASHLQNSVIPLQQARPDLPVWLCEWVMWHIQRDMNHRPDSAKLALDKFLADESLAAQGGMGQTQQLITPAAPLLRKNTTGPVGTQPAGTLTGPLAVQPARQGTAPQPILSPDGRPNPNTSPTAIQPTGHLGSAPVNINSGSTTSHVENPDANIPDFHAPPKKPINKTMLIVLGSMLVVGGIILTLFISGASEEKKHQETYARLIKGIEAKFQANETLPVTREELDNLLTSMIKTSIKDKIGGYYALSIAEAIDGEFSPTLEIAKFATTPGQPITDESMSQIFRAIALNPKFDPKAHKLLLDYAIKNPNKKQSGEAIKRMEKFADDSYIDNILSVYEVTNQITTRASCANTVAAIVKRSKAKNSIASKIIARYNKAVDIDIKLAYLRLLGNTGTKDAFDILYKALNSKDILFRLSAHKGLSSGSNIEPFDALLKVYVAETNASHKKKYRNNLIDLLESNIKITPAKRSELWTKFIEQTPSQAGKKQVIGSVATSEKSAWATKVLNTSLQSPDLDDKIKTSVKKKLEEWSKKSN
ncbi:MAG: serine/threonine protein kinase [Akkermansiaceae bacterium]